MNKIKKKNLIYVIAILVFAVGLIWFSQSKNQDYDAVVYKSPTCSCCREYISYLETKGYNIKTKTVNDMQVVKDKYNISPKMESCHTMVMNDYVIEGHVPVEVVEKLINEKPNISGISIPDMPAGSPGMPGIKQEPFSVYTLADNNSIYTKY